jgi:hypothetical protein
VITVPRPLKKASLGCKIDKRLGEDIYPKEAEEKAFIIARFLQ